MPFIHKIVLYTLTKRFSYRAQHGKHSNITSSILANFKTTGLGIYLCAIRQLYQKQ